MNLFNTIFTSFIPIVENDVNAIDKFTSTLVSYNISNFIEFDESVLNVIISKISDKDKFILSFKIGENEEINLQTKDISTFFQDIVKERELIEDELVFFKLEIKKNIEKSINIYDFDNFDKFWKTTPLINLLRLLKDYQTSEGHLTFVFFEKDIESFYSQNIIFSSINQKQNFPLNNTISENCHFGNVKEFPFNPYFFNLVKRPIVENSISKILDKLSLMFCIISIYDITSITDSKLYFKLNGYKSFEGYIDIDNLDEKLNTEYFKIFNWIYSEDSKISDKIGLSRNIISLSLKDSDISITESIYLSIQSAYKTYLRDNISKYIEIRNKIVDEIGWISQKAGEIVANYLSNYQKSIFTFLSFFISVFLLRFLSGKETKEVFSKDVTIFSFAFLLLSFIYLFFSLWSIYLEKKRLTRKYDNLKNRYTDLLNPDDIKQILKGDAEFDYELNFIDRRTMIYTILWVVTIIVLIFSVLSVSDYLNWNSIYTMIKKINICLYPCNH